MLVENIMYFALGFLAAGLLALMIMPSIWQRAVRLTKMRIEAATPMTMAEFRADKDQLRAEFALSTRRLEKNVEALRTRLADQLGDINYKKSELGLLKSERDQHVSIVQELEDREGELRRRVMELEKTAADAAQRLRMRDRAFEELEARLKDAHEQGNHLSNLPDLDELYADLSAERQRASFFEQQAESLAARLEQAEKQTSGASNAVAEMRRALAMREDEHDAHEDALTAAESRIASAESRLNALLEETHESLEGADSQTQQLLADKLSLEEELEGLRRKVADVENSVLHDWEKERLDQSHLRERLNDIASEVSRLVYAVDGEAPITDDESLFDRVKKYAGDSLEAKEVSSTPLDSQTRSGLANRMSALRELQAIRATTKSS